MCPIPSCSSFERLNRKRTGFIRELKSKFKTTNRGVCVTAARNNNNNNNNNNNKLTKTIKNKRKEENKETKTEMGGGDFKGKEQVRGM